MKYQLCRWYDPYPRLVFALQVLYLVPDERRRCVAEQIETWVEEALGNEIDDLSEFEPNDANRQGNRWYDRDPEVGRMIEQLRWVPDGVKVTIADRLIKTLTGQSQVDAA